MVGQLNNRLVIASMRVSCGVILAIVVHSNNRTYPTVPYCSLINLTSGENIHCEHATTSCAMHANLRSTVVDEKRITYISKTNQESKVRMILHDCVLMLRYMCAFLCGKCGLIGGKW